MRMTCVSFTPPRLSGRRFPLDFFRRRADAGVHIKNTTGSRGSSQKKPPLAHSRDSPVHDPSEDVLALTCWPLGRCCNCICWLLCSCCCCSAYRLQGRSHRSTCRWPLVDFADDDVITPPADTVDDVTVQMPDSCDDIVCAVSIIRTHPWSWYLEERFCYEADKIKHVLRKWRLISVKVRVQVMLSAITWITLLTFNNVRA